MKLASASEDLQDWPTIEQAADEINASVRTIWRHNERGLLEIQKRPVPGRKPINVCNPSDLNRLKPPPYAVAKEEEAESTSREIMLPMSKVSEAVERIVTIFQGRQDAVMMPPPRAWITPAEAAEISGLTETYIRDRVRVGLIDAVRGGPHGALRIRRASLEAFSGY